MVSYVFNSSEQFYMFWQFVALPKIIYNTEYSHGTVYPFNPSRNSVIV